MNDLCEVSQSLLAFVAANPAVFVAYENPAASSKVMTKTDSL